AFWRNEARSKNPAISTALVSPRGLSTAPARFPTGPAPSQLTPHRDCPRTRPGNGAPGSARSAGRSTRADTGKPMAEGQLGQARGEVYRQSGVATAEADSGLQNIIRRVQGTWPASGMGRVVLPIGYFANVIDLGGVGIAICTDGVGSKTII